MKYVSQLFTTLPKKFTSEFLQYCEEVNINSIETFRKQKKGMFPRHFIRLAHHEYLNLGATVQEKKLSVSYH